MSQLEIASASFIPVEMGKSLVPYRDLLLNTAAPLDPNEYLGDRIGQEMFATLTTATATSTALNRMDSRLPPEPRSMDDLERAFVVDALHKMQVDFNFQAFGYIFGKTVAYYETHSDTSEIPMSELDLISDRILNGRARHNAISLLKAHAWLRGTREDLGDHASVWDRAIEAHDKATNVKPPVQITEDDCSTIDRLIDATEVAIDAHSPQRIMKVSSLNFVNNSRMVKVMRKMTKSVRNISNPDDLFMVIDEMVFNSLETLIPQVDLSTDELVKGMRIGVKMRRYLASAAVVDPSIKADPRSRYTTLLASELKGYDFKAERARYQAYKTKVARQERKHLQADGA